MESSIHAHAHAYAQIYPSLQANALGHGFTHEHTGEGMGSDAGKNHLPGTHFKRRPLNDVIKGWQRHGGHGQYHTQVPVQTQPRAANTPGPVYSMIHRIDRFTGGFAPGTISLLESQHEFMFNMLARMIVNSVKTSDRDVIYLDGGNSLDPYLLALACRLFRLDAEHVLRRVQVARAFTVFQLDTLITQSLERILERHRPRLVLVSCISELFLDRDVNWHEAQTMFETDLKKIQALTKRYGLTTILTNFGRDKSIHRFELNRRLRKWLAPENRLSIKRPSHCKLRFVKGTGEFMDYLPLPAYQWSLDDFFPGGDLCG